MEFVYPFSVYLSSSKYFLFVLESITKKIYGHFSVDTYGEHAPWIKTWYRQFKSGDFKV